MSGWAMRIRGIRSVFVGSRRGHAKRFVCVLPMDVSRPREVQQGRLEFNGRCKLSHVDHLDGLLLLAPAHCNVVASCSLDIFATCSRSDRVHMLVLVPLLFNSIPDGGWKGFVSRE